MAALSTLALAWPAAAQAQTATGTSRANIVQPISLSVTQELNFGSIVPSTTRTSTARINLNDTATMGGGALLIGTTHKTSRMAGQGTRNQIVLITRPTTVWLSGPGPQMRARSWTLGTTTGLTRTTGNQYRITGTGGNFTFRMGATLDIARNQPEGLYQGSFVVTVNYQ
jgi:hypothetical protein